MKDNEIEPGEWDVIPLAYEESNEPIWCARHKIWVDPVVDVVCGYCENEALARMERRIPNEELDDFPPEGYY